jgi:hypothetical protein
MMGLHLQKRRFSCSGSASDAAGMATDADKLVPSGTGRPEAQDDRPPRLSPWDALPDSEPGQLPGSESSHANA